MLMGTIEIENAIPVEADAPFLEFVSGRCNSGQDIQISSMSADPDVLFDLGMMHASGRMGCVDLIAAHKWFNLAALRGRADAIHARREVAEQMSADEVAVAQREARAWMTTH